MKLYKTLEGNLLHSENEYYLMSEGWDSLLNRDNLHQYLKDNIPVAKKIPAPQADEWVSYHLLAPVGQQEVWAAGVTYLRSRDARIEESYHSGGADLYDKVYEADRPELFFKSVPHRVQGHNQTLYIRHDSGWNVPEPECTLFINSNGNIQGYTIGNDMSSRSIEGENALYLPQAKVYEKSAALGPCIFVPDVSLPSTTKITMTITRNRVVMYNDSTTLKMMKRSFTELVGFLYRECDFIHGSFLMTGTCLVPNNDFTLHEDDRVDISITGIGVLTNHVGYKPLHVPN
jgi:2-dehydro-3-deoxy-D-arabinonate dehydratase